MWARHPKDDLSTSYVTKPISHTFSDKRLWQKVKHQAKQVAKHKRRHSVDDSHGNGPPPLPPPPAGVWSYAYGAYKSLCDVCWGVCAYATGFGGEAGHSHGPLASSGQGYIKLPLDGEESSIASDEEEDHEFEPISTPPTTTATEADSREMAITAKVFQIFGKRTQKLIAKTTKLGSQKTRLSHSDMSTILGLSAWSWVDVDFVRALHVMTLRNQRLAAAAHDGDGDEQDEDEETVLVPTNLQVDKGWFRWITDMVGP